MLGRLERDIRCADRTLALDCLLLRAATLLLFPERVDFVAQR